MPENEVNPDDPILWEAQYHQALDNFAQVPESILILCEPTRLSLAMTIDPINTLLGVIYAAQIVRYILHAHGRYESTEKIQQDTLNRAIQETPEMFENCPPEILKTLSPEQLSKLPESVFETMPDPIIPD